MRRISLLKQINLIDPYYITQIKFENDDDRIMADFLFLEYEYYFEDGLDGARVSTDEELARKIGFLRRPHPGRNPWYNSLTSSAKHRFAQSNLPDIYEESMQSDDINIKNKYRDMFRRILILLN